jgi:hypothetical protein
MKEAPCTLKCQSTSKRLYGSISQNPLIFTGKLYLSTTSHLLHSLPHGHLTRGFLTEFYMLSYIPTIVIILYLSYPILSADLRCIFSLSYFIKFIQIQCYPSNCLYCDHPGFQYCLSSPEVPKLCGVTTPDGAVGPLRWHALFLWWTYLFWTNMGAWYNKYLGKNFAWLKYEACFTHYLKIH